MADLKFNTEELAVTRRRVGDARSVLASMTNEAHVLAQAVGHDGLAQEVRAFGDRWTIARGRLTEQLTFIHDALTAIEQTIADLDRDMARNALEFQLEQ